jgi:hypothetical protein
MDEDEKVENFDHFYAKILLALYSCQENSHIGMCS